MVEVCSSQDGATNPDPSPTGPGLFDNPNRGLKNVKPQSRIQRKLTIS